MINFSSFVDEMCKIAQDDGTVQFVPEIKRLPQDADQAIESIKRRIDKSRKVIIGHKNVAVPAKRLGDLTGYGFKKTRLAVPLPGEAPGTPSWRRDDLHAHKRGDYYLMHKDKVAPEGVIRGIKHWFHEGLPATRKRLREREAPMIEGMV